MTDVTKHGFGFPRMFLICDFSQDGQEINAEYHPFIESSAIVTFTSGRLGSNGTTVTYVTVVQGAFFVRHC